MGGIDNPAPESYPIESARGRGSSLILARFNCIIPQDS